VNYQKHYDKLINRAKWRKLEGYGEKHHIVPKCLGGGEQASNKVKLTAEEHYVAHQLLVKIYPKITKLAYALVFMSGENNNKRCNNKFLICLYVLLFLQPLFYF